MTTVATNDFKIEALQQRETKNVCPKFKVSRDGKRVLLPSFFCVCSLKDFIGSIPLFNYFALSLKGPYTPPNQFQAFI